MPPLSEEDRESALFMALEKGLELKERCRIERNRRIMLFDALLEIDSILVSRERSPADSIEAARALIKPFRRGDWERDAGDAVTRS